MSGLDGYADANCDGIVPAQELAQYIEAQVRKASMDMQRPSAAMPGQLQNLPLARLGAPRCAGISPPDRKGDLRVKLDRFDCKDSPALVQVNGCTAGTICVGGMLWIPGLPAGNYKVRVSRADTLLSETAVTISPNIETPLMLDLKPRPPRSASVERELKRAIRLYTEGGADPYKGALDVLSGLRAESPSDPELDYRIGRAQRKSAGSARIGSDRSGGRGRDLVGVNGDVSTGEVTKSRGGTDQ